MTPTVTASATADPLRFLSDLGFASSCRGCMNEAVEGAGGVAILCTEYRWSILSEVGS